MEVALELCSTDHRCSPVVRDLAKAGFKLTNLSIVGKGYHSEEKVVGFYTAGQRIKMWELETNGRLRR